MSGSKGQAQEANKVSETSDPLNAPTHALSDFIEVLVMVGFKTKSRLSHLIGGFVALGKVTNVKRCLACKSWLEPLVSLQTRLSSSGSFLID